MTTPLIVHQSKSNWATAVFCLLLFTVLVIYTVTYHHRLPYFDDWDLAPYLEKYFRGELRFADIFAIHGNSHWHVGAFAVMIPLAVYSHWNTLYFVIVNLGLSLWIVAIMGYLLRDTATRNTLHFATPVLFGTAAFFVFSLDQADNWLWGFQIALFMNLASAITAIVVLTRKRLSVLHTLTAVSMVVFATYNYTTGLALWPIGLLLLLFHPGVKQAEKIAHLSFYSICAMAVIYHFHVSFARLNVIPTSIDAVHQFVYVVEFLGCGISRTAPKVSMLLGMLGIGMSGWMLWLLYSRSQIELPTLLPYIALALYAIGCAGLTSFGRVEYGTSQARAPRYISFSYLLWMSDVLLAMIAYYTLDSRSLRKVVVAAVAVVLVLKTVNIVNVADKVARSATHYDSYETLVRAQYPVIGDEVLGRLYPNPEFSRGFLAIMHRYRLNLFREDNH